MKLTDSNVNEVFTNCLHDDKKIAGLDREAVKAKATLVDGITVKVGFDTEMIEKHREDIKSMLSELPDEFMHDKGGGYTFLAACDDRNGNRWTEAHRTMEKLFMLGQAIKCVRYCLPRDFWRAFPGGVPYYAVSFDGFPAKTA